MKRVSKRSFRLGNTERPCCLGRADPFGGQEHGVLRRPAFQDFLRQHGELPRFDRTLMPEGPLILDPRQDT